MVGLGMCTWAPMHCWCIAKYIYAKYIYMQNTYVFLFFYWAKYTYAKQECTCSVSQNTCIENSAVVVYPKKHACRIHKQNTDALVVYRKVLACKIVHCLCVANYLHRKCYTASVSEVAQKIVHQQCIEKHLQRKQCTSSVSKTLPKKKVQ